MKRYLLDVVVEKDKNGYFAYCPLIQGCYTQGKTYEQALENIKDAIRLHLEEIEASKGKISSPESISVTTLEIAA
jgi:predicted RNase H-like HicB family nuclease